MNYRWIIFSLILNISFLNSNLQGQTFKTIVLGSGGGIKEDNLSAYLIAPGHSNDFICLDAGTVYSGIDEAVKAGNFYDVFVPAGEEASKTGYIFRELIKGYLISHAHLDHVAGLVIASPASRPIKVYGSAKTIEILKDHIFNWQVWPNFGNDGEGVRLGTYDYNVFISGEKYEIAETRFAVQAFPLSHQNPTESTAFLLEYLDAFVLYVGDTGADELEGTNNLESLWLAIAPLLRDDKLKGMFLECSYPDEQEDSKLYGHLNPKWLFKELSHLAVITDSINPETALKGLPVIITGIKPSWKEGGDNKYLIYKQLLKRNNLGVKFIIPEQGQLIEF
jgi:3',5'-cyclic-nucleotide phosphodiesterase